MARLTDIIRKLRAEQEAARAKGVAPASKDIRSGVLEAIDSTITAHPPELPERSAEPIDATGIENELMGIFNPKARADQTATAPDTTALDEGSDPEEAPPATNVVAEPQPAEAKTDGDEGLAAVSFQDPANDEDTASPSSILSEAEINALLPPEEPPSERSVDEGDPPIQPHSIEPVPEDRLEHEEVPEMPRELAEPVAPAAENDAALDDLESQTQGLAEMPEEPTETVAPPTDEDTGMADLESQLQGLSDMPAPEPEGDAQVALDILDPVARPSSDPNEEPDDMQARAAQIGDDIDALGSPSVPELPDLNSMEPVDPPLGDANLDDPPDDDNDTIVFADDISDSLLSKYGIDPEEVNLPTRDEWEQGKNHEGLSLEDVEAQRDALLAEMGIDLEELRAEQEAEMQAEEELPAPPSEPTETDTPPADDDTGLADLEDQLSGLSDIPEVPEEESPQSVLGGGLHSTGNRPKVDMNADSVAEPLAASDDLRSELEQEFESEVAAESGPPPEPEPSSSEAGDPSDSGEAPEPEQPFAGSFLSPDDDPEPEAEPEASPVPPPLKVTVTASREELFGELEPESPSLEDYTNSPMELVKVLIGLISLVLILALAALLALG